MLSEKVKRSMLTGSVLLVVAAITSVAVFAQTAEPVQVAANNTVAPLASKPAGDVTLPTSALQARIDAQQQEINKLSALVERLQAMLDPVASTRPILPNARIGFMPEPAGSPSPSPSPSPATASSGYTAPRELLPDIGHIGAEVGLFEGVTSNPYKDNDGFGAGGFIDLPYKRVAGGKLSYEIMIDLQTAKTSTISTSGVNALVNTALNNYLYEAGDLVLPSVLGYLTGPLPTYQQPVVERSKVMTVAPVLLKYTITKMGRFRPYIVGGLGTYVWIGSDNNSKSFNAVTALNTYGASLPTPIPTLGTLYGPLFNALLQGSQIGGLAPAAPELIARGVPHGQGNLLFGGQIGGGAELRLSPKLSFGVDIRHNQMEGKNAGFNTFSFTEGLHW
jgi:opacity protein-like surface antigen